MFYVLWFGEDIVSWLQIMAFPNDIKQPETSLAFKGEPMTDKVGFACSTLLGICKQVIL